MRPPFLSSTVRLQAWVLLVASLGLWPAWSPGASLALEPASNVDVQELMSKAVARVRETRRQPPQHEFVRTKTTLYYGSGDTVEEQEEKVFRTTVVDGREKTRLVRKDGKDVPPKASKPANADQPPKPRAPTDDRRRGGDSLLSQLNDTVVKRFVWTVAGREEVGGRWAHVVDMKPRKDVSAKDIEEQVMSRLAGRIWLDEQDHDVVKVDIHLEDTVKIGWGGLLGALRDFKLGVERLRLDDGTWINSSTEVWVHFRQLFSTKRIRHREVVSNVVKVVADDASQAPVPRPPAP